MNYTLDTNRRENSVLENQADDDGVDRRGFLSCMAWAGTGVIWAVSGGVLSSRAFGQQPAHVGPADFTFIQVSDSHIGFKKPPNQDVTATLERAVAQINGLPQAPALLLHTGDVTHLSKPDEFDTCAQ